MFLSSCPTSPSRSMDFFLPISLRASTRFVECESNKLPASENIFRKFIYGWRARRNGAHCVPKTVLYNAMYSYVARTGKRRTYSWADLRIPPLLFACLLMYLAWCIIRHLPSITVDSDAIFARDANLSTGTNMYSRVTQFMRRITEDSLRYI